MKSNKLLLITTLILCFACVLSSCDTHDDTNSRDDVNKDMSTELSTPSESFAANIMSDGSSAESSELTDETSEEVSDPVEESSEESSEEISPREPYYEKKITDEMADAVWVLAHGRDIPRYSLSSQEFKDYLLDLYLEKKSYYAFGNLNGYTLFTTQFLTANDAAVCKYQADDYVFMSSVMGNSPSSRIFLYLYRNNELFTFETAYEQGLFDPKDAYELIVNNPCTDNPYAMTIRAEKADD